MGGFPAQPAPAAPPSQQTATISQAVAQPAAPPPSQRTVKTAPAAAAQPEESDKGVPDEMTGAFDALMKLN
jgi:hypothetical protein